MYIEEAVKLNGTGLLETAQISSTKKGGPPPVISQLAIEHGPFSSVIYLLTMVIFPSKALVYQRISCKTKRFVYGTSHRVDS